LNHERKVNLNLLEANEESFERRTTVTLLSDEKLRIALGELKEEKMKVEELEGALSERLASD
jgi:hypothetical protein